MFIPNAAFIAVLSHEAKTQSALEKAAGEAAREANKIRHHIMPRKAEGAIEVQTIDGDVYLVNTDHGGHLDEWGSSNNPVYAPLRNGVRRAGFDLIET